MDRGVRGSDMENPRWRRHLGQSRCPGISARAGAVREEAAEAPGLPGEAPTRGKLSLVLRPFTPARQTVQAVLPAEQQVSLHRTT